MHRPIKNSKKEIINFKNHLIDDLKLHKNGLNFSQKYSKSIDEIIKSIVCEIDSSQDEYVLIAVGGYGRNEMCLYSDIDLLFIYKKQDSFIKSLISNLNNGLWDTGLDIGISFLTIKSLANAIFSFIEPENR